MAYPIPHERMKEINQIDVNYRELEDNDNQFEVIKYVLNCLSDEQLRQTKKLIKVWKRHEKGGN